MGKMRNILLGIGGMATLGYAIYKGVSTTEPKKYSLKWIESLSDEQWSKERQIVQDQFRNPNLDIEFRDKCKVLLDLFDKVKSARDWAGVKPHGPAYHREHGFNLYKPD